MKIFFISKESNGGDMALRLGMEGNEVKYYVAEKGLKNLDGLIDKETNWRSGVNWADLVVFDDTGLDEQAAYVSKTKKPAFGIGHSSSTYRVHGETFQGFQFQSVLESARNMAQEVMSDYKVGEEIESLSFSDPGKAIQHLKSHKVKHVIKPEVQGSGSEKTYVGHFEDNSDCIDWLEGLSSRPGGGKVKSIEVEERREGVEVAVAAWFNGKDFIGPVNINFEHKKIYAGDTGFNTGEMGTTMFYDKRPFSKVPIFNSTLGKMSDFFAKFDYRGQIDINCIVDKEGIWPLEFTPRLGYPSSYIEDEIQITKWGELFYAIGSGRNISNSVSSDWALGVVLVGEGYPFWDEGHERSDDLPVYGLDPDSIAHLHPYDVKFDEKKKKFLTTGCYPLTATSSAATIEEARSKVYDKMIPKTYFPGMGYRNDIGKDTTDRLSKLKEWGYDFGR